MILVTASSYRHHRLWCNVAPPNQSNGCLLDSGMVAQSCHRLVYSSWHATRQATASACHLHMPSVKPPGCHSAISKDNRAILRQKSLWKGCYFRYIIPSPYSMCLPRITFTSVLVIHLDSCVSLRELRYLSVKLCMFVHSLLSWRVCLLKPVPFSLKPSSIH